MMLRCAALLVLLAVPVAALASTPQGPERRAVLDAAREPAERGAGRPVRFLVTALNREGEWAFLYATMQRPDGGRLRLGGAAGVPSDDYAALLRRTAGGWTVVTHAVGPTDVAWANWGPRFGAPDSVFTIRRQRHPSCDDRD